MAKFVLVWRDGTPQYVGELTNVVGECMSIIMKDTGQLPNGELVFVRLLLEDGSTWEVERTQLHQMYISNNTIWAKRQFQGPEVPMIEVHPWVHRLMKK